MIARKGRIAKEFIQIIQFVLILVLLYIIVKGFNLI